MLYKNVVHIIQYNMIRPETIYTQTSKKDLVGWILYTHLRTMVLGLCTKCYKNVTGEITIPPSSGVPHTNYMKTYFTLYEI